ncbi:acyl-CoA dehydrogenase family protein [Dactylosporangium sp. CA-092794]|uniref:acyl-CoA dehydrogenase family protein n=1 Tax=Dactylosporangium sp. CA-092794 TaxID=3239929 RepID=UPI003D8BF1BD
MFGTSSSAIDDDRGALEDALVDRVREIVGAPDYLQRAVDADRAGQLSIDNVRALQEAGITGLVVDPRFGPNGARLELVVRVMEALAYRDASTSVALNMHWLGGRTLARLPSFPRRDEALAAIAAHEALICGAFSIPTGGLDSRKAALTCREAGDDLVFNGRAGFGSMSDAASYAMLGGTVAGSDASDPAFAITVGRFGEPGLINHHNWSAMGMRATASNDIECRDLCIPKSDCLIAPMSSFKARRQTETAAVAFGITAIWLGLSQAAFDFTVDYTQNRYGYMASGTFNASASQYRADEAWAQSAIGNMDHWLGTGRVLLRDMVARLNDYADESVLTRDLLRTLFHLRRMSEEVAMGAMKTCGAHGFVTERPLERIFRDLIGGIVMAWKTDQIQQTLGIGALGRPITFTGPAGS